MRHVGRGDAARHRPAADAQGRSALRKRDSSRYDPRGFVASRGRRLVNFNYVEITTCASVGFLERLYEFHPVARGLGVEGHCRLLMGDVLPRETENTVYRGLVYVLQVFLKDIPSFKA